MTKRDQQAREARLLALFSGFPSFADKVTAEMLDTYLQAVGPYATEIVDRAIADFISQDVPGYNPAFPPTAPMLAGRCQVWMGIVEKTGRRLEDRQRGDLVSYPMGEPPPKGYTPLGPIKVNFGHGAIDMSEMTHEEKEAVMRAKGLPGQTTVIPHMRSAVDAVVNKAKAAMGAAQPEPKRKS